MVGIGICNAPAFIFDRFGNGQALHPNRGTVGGKVRKYSQYNINNRFEDPDRTVLPGPDADIKIRPAGVDITVNEFEQAKAGCAAGFA